MWTLRDSKAVEVDVAFEQPEVIGSSALVRQGLQVRCFQRGSGSLSMSFIVPLSIETLSDTGSSWKTTFS